MLPTFAHEYKLNNALIDKIFNESFKLNKLLEKIHLINRISANIYIIAKRWGLESYGWPINSTADHLRKATAF
jgi:hypothetical protein